MTVCERSEQKLISCFNLLQTNDETQEEAGSIAVNQNISAGIRGTFSLEQENL